MKRHPQQELCSIHGDEDDQLMAEAEEPHGKAKGVVGSALINMVGLLRQPAPRSLLEQGKQQPFIADVLAQKCPQPSECELRSYAAP